MINNIYVVQHQVLLDVWLLTEFHRHLNAYIASYGTTSSIYVWAQELLDHHVYGLYLNPDPLNAVDSYNYYYIILKYSVIKV